MTLRYDPFTADELERARRHFEAQARAYIEGLYRDVVPPRERARRAVRELGRALVDAWHQRGA